jgi:hypothetical protein
LRSQLNSSSERRFNGRSLWLSALYAAKDKLAYYYAKTDDIPGDILAIGTILAPQHKLQFFKNWAEEDVDWTLRYQKSCKDFFEPYKQQYLKRIGKMPAHDYEDEASEITLDMMIQPGEASQVDQQDELTKYFNTSKYLFHINLS